MKNQEIDWLLAEKYHGKKTAGFFADCERLAAGEPLAYIIGHAPFLNCQIWLDSRPLIPRPETEFWVENAITELRKIISPTSQPAGGAFSTLYQATPLRECHSSAMVNNKYGENLPNKSASEDTTAWPLVKHPQRECSERGHAESGARRRCPISVLDLCAGSGAIGVAVAKAVPNTHVTFAEIDPIHLPTIKKNYHENGLADDRHTIIASDLFAHVPGTFDFILTNPPYIDATANTVDATVVEHEPHLALFGGVAGMEIIGRIIAGARAKLAPPITHHRGGQLWIEHEPFQAEAIARLAVTHGFSITHHPDQYDTVRYSVLMPTMAQ